MVLGTEEDDESLKAGNPAAEIVFTCYSCWRFGDYQNQESLKNDLQSTSTTTGLDDNETGRS